jgi:hypothetical protein
VSNADLVFGYQDTIFSHLASVVERAIFAAQVFELQFLFTRIVSNLGVIAGCEGIRNANSVGRAAAEGGYPRFDIVDLNSVFS